MKELIWTQRFKKLKRRGFTYRQIDIVFELLSECKAFGYEHVEYSAREQLDKLKKGYKTTFKRV